MLMLIRCVSMVGEKFSDEKMLLSLLLVESFATFRADYNYLCYVFPSFGFKAAPNFNCEETLKLLVTLLFKANFSLFSGSFKSISLLYF